MRALAELIEEAQRIGLVLDIRPGSPKYLADAAGSVTAVASPQEGSLAGARLVLAPQVVSVRPGDWLIVDWPVSAGAAVGLSAAELAQAGLQAYEVLRLPEERAVLIAHGATQPEAIGPAFGSPLGAAVVLEAGRAASATDLLVMANLTVLGPVQASNVMAAMAQRYQTELAPLRGGLEERCQAQARQLDTAAATEQRLRRELTERYRREDLLRKRLAVVNRSPLYRLARRLKRLAGRDR
ncbi:MAG: hypothetical protein LBJ02_10845 [Bifidobacteriaceae bacterium]|jgi:hypothetical protein|nr:hypothetical protein [Bifidobacteriaceae bacterium]